MLLAAKPKPLPAKGKSGAPQRDHLGRAKTWDVNAGKVVDHRSHKAGQYAGAWVGIDDHNPRADPIPAGKPGGRGRPRKGSKKWDPKGGAIIPHPTHCAGQYEGSWVEDDDEAEDMEDASSGDAGVVAAEEPAAKKPKECRKFQASWVCLLPMLYCVKVAAVACCPSIRAGACPGCSACAVMYCRTCVASARPPCKGSTQNAFADGGASCFRLSSVREHAQNYHAGELDAKQPGILTVSEWGVTKSWVILKKAAPLSDREKRMKSRA